MTTAKALKSPRDLIQAGLIPANRIAELEAVSQRYSIAVTPAMIGLIDANDAADPIARQFLPSGEELLIRPEERADPIGDAVHSPVKGIVHRYPDRVLLKAVHVCPVYCRFCFRREMVGPQGDGTLSATELQAAFDYIAYKTEIWEVILTGGDPLVLSPRRLAEIMRGLKEIKHVKVVRFHTRVPVVDPVAITPELVSAIAESGKTAYVALHANHPREMTEEARSACARLIDGGIAMVSQTVLLRGVNDDPGILADLMRAFVETRVKPYYLHHPDLAPGTSHFRMDVTEGQAIVAALRGRLSGLCQPTYVLDIPGGFGKTPLAASTIRQVGEGCYSVADYQGREHAYPPV
jgi:lysine 2,3-aminomutase